MAARADEARSARPPASAVTEAIRTELPQDARQAVEAFLESLAGRNASPGTIIEYRRHTTEFLAFLAGRGVDWTRPDRSTIRAYLSALADRELAASSVAGRLAAIRSLYRHALRNGRSRPIPSPASARPAVRRACPASSRSTRPRPSSPRRGACVRVTKRWPAATRRCSRCSTRRGCGSASSRA